MIDDPSDIGNQIVSNVLSKSARHTTLDMDNSHCVVGVY